MILTGMKHYKPRITDFTSICGGAGTTATWAPARACQSFLEERLSHLQQLLGKATRMKRGNPSRLSCTVFVG